MEGPGACARADCERWKALLQAQGLAALEAVAGTQVDLGDGVLLRVLHPPGHGLGGEGAPLVLRLDYGRTCFLLAGGAGRAEEAALLAGGAGLGCDVLQVGRDGGDEAFLEAVRPGLAVASCGEEGEDVLARLNRYAGTAVCVGQQGSLEVISDGQRYEVRTGR
jgi:competence protein ComEC